MNLQFHDYHTKSEYNCKSAVEHSLRHKITTQAIMDNKETNVLGSKLSYQKCWAGRTKQKHSLVLFEGEKLGCSFWCFGKDGRKDTFVK